MLVYLLFCAVFLGLAWGLHALWRRRIAAEIAEGATSEWERLHRQEPGLLDGLSFKEFAAIYAKVETPRFPAYVLTAVTAFLAGTPVLLGAMNAVAYFADRAGVIPKPSAAVSYLTLGEGGTAAIAQRITPEGLQYVLEGWAGFYYFFGLLFFWVLIVALAMRRYHARTPGFLREEVLRAR